MIDPEEGESVRSSERWETGGGGDRLGRERRENVQIGTTMELRALDCEAGDGLIVSEERGQDEMFTSKGEIE